MPQITDHLISEIGLFEGPNFTWKHYCLLTGEQFYVTSETFISLVFYVLFLQLWRRQKMVVIYETMDTCSFNTTGDQVPHIFSPAVCRRTHLQWQVMCLCQYWVYWDVSIISAEEWKATQMQAEKNTKQLLSMQHRQRTHSLAEDALDAEVLYMSPDWLCIQEPTE